MNSDLSEDGIIAGRSPLSVARTIAELDSCLAEPWQAETTDPSRLAIPGSPRRAVVMTMGGLHEGHGALLVAGRDLVGPSGQLVVTIFVNPTQFSAAEDLSKYPRAFESDLDICAAHEADVVFAPMPEVIYPAGELVVTVDPGALGQRYEGEARPTHFRGVLTVVAKLINLTRPDFAMFGEKDYQQLTLVTRMASDLNMPTRVVGVPIVRAPDGLALSTRNKYLSDADREAALAIPTAIETGRRAAIGGASADEVVAAVREVLAAVPSLTTDYVVVTDPRMGQAPIKGEARLIVAAVVNGTRLLDNTCLELVPGGPQ